MAHEFEFSKIMKKKKLVLIDVYTCSLFRYGVGNRIKLGYTRKIIDAIHSGSLLKANYKRTQVFGLEIPTEIEGVPSGILDPINTVSRGS